MRISDWSSDVCFSDLGGQAVEVPARAGGRPRRARVRGSDPDRLLPADIFEQLQRQPEGRGREAEAARRHVPGRSECGGAEDRSEEHTSELQSLMRISYAVFCLKKKNNTNLNNQQNIIYNML